MINTCAVFSKTILQPPINSQHFSIHLVKEGSALLEIDKEKVTIQAPCILCLNNQQAFEVLNTNNLFVHTIIFNLTLINNCLSCERFENSFCNNITKKHCLFQIEPFLNKNIEKHILFPNLEQILYFENCYYNLYNQLQFKNDSLKTFRVRSFFMDIISGIEKLYYNFGKFSKETLCPDNLFTQITSYINQNLDKKLQISDICSVFSINRNKLQNLFKNNLDVTFHEYLKKQKTYMACHYLNYTNLTISEIGYVLGFSSVQNFCRFFKNEFGMPPGDYKSLNINK